MIVKLHTQGLQTLEQIQAFLDGSQPLDIELRDRQQAYRFIGDTLRHFRYAHRSRAEKGVLRRYLVKVTGLSRAQITRLPSPPQVRNGSIIIETWQPV